MANFDLLSSDAPAPARAAARGGTGIVGDYADEVVRNAKGAVCWRGPVGEAAAPLSDLALIAGELARRGLRATVSVEPVANGELVAAVHLTA